jgi:peptide/nickel transport system substrate-binding protein
MSPQSLSRAGHAGSTVARIASVLIIGSLVLFAPRATAAHGRALLPAADLGTVMFATDGAPADIDPASDALIASDVVARSVAETLVGLDGASVDRYTPVLATSWDVNATKSVWTFHLRHGVRFHTGRCCMTAEDVQYSLARTMTAGLTNAYLLGRFISKPFNQIRILDPYTVQFELGRPQPVFLGALAQNYATLILDSHALKAHEKNHDWGHAWATEHDAGTGPYVIQSWQHGQQVVLTRFPDYWRGWSGGHFSRVIVRIVPEATTRRELVESGQADFTSGLTVQDYQALEKDPRVSVVVGYGLEVQYIVMTEAGPLASPYARQALSYAFNYDAYVHGILRGFARRAYGPFARNVLGYDPHTFHYQTDLTKARHLLQQAGVKPGTTLIYTYTGDAGAGEILQAQLQQLGINVKLQRLDTAAYNSVFYGTQPLGKRPNLLPWDWWPDYNDPYNLCAPLLASSETPPTGANAGFYHNKQVDALLAQMKNADRETLLRLSRKLQDITGRVDPPAIWLAEPGDVTVLAKHLKGYVFNPLYPHTYDFYSLHR